MTGLISGFPEEWRTEAVVLRGGGRDAKSNPLPVAQIPVVPPCAFAPRATSDPNDHSDVASTTGVLYCDPGFTFLPKDRIRISAGFPGAGEWMVDGRPKEWPLGWEIGLVAG